jgi:Uma2 family endonuclease
VREYWLVDPNRNRVRVWRRQPDGTFARVADLSREQHDVITTPLLPQLAISLVQLFS